MRLLSFIDGESGYCSLLATDDGVAAIRADGEEQVQASADGPIEEGRATMASDDGALEVSWSPAGPMLEFTLGTLTATVHGIVASGEHGGRKLSGPGITWHLPDGGYSALRTVWAITAKSNLLVLVSLRPEDSREHGEDVVGAARIVPKAEPYGYLEPLLSTEYGPDGSHRRATLELWADEEATHPERAGGRRVTGGAAGAGAARVETARFAWSIDGTAAVGGYEIVTP